jgi:nicotinate phosphoribosyltransferase
MLPFVSPGGLLVDLYHIDSAYVSWKTGQNPVVTFDLYTRHNPFGGSFLLVAGLELAAGIASRARLSDDDLQYLRSLRGYDEAFLAHLRQLRFTGSIAAIREGEIAFANEPLMRVTGPFQEAILLESVMLHTIGVSTLIATKAARIVRAAAGRSVAEFGFRRAQAPYLAARSAYIGGCTSTSFVDAAKMFAIPSSGTIPHALVELYPTEEHAFTAVAETLNRYSLLLDTYDVMNGIDTAIRVAHAARQRTGHELASVRLDSGDMAADAFEVRKRLDAAGLSGVRILASGDLDEWRVAELVATAAPIDGFGLGTSLSTGAGSAERGIDGGALGGVFKLVWVEGGDPPVKIAGEKSTWPGIKQVVRAGDFEKDMIQLRDEPVPDNFRKLLVPVIEDGEIIDGALDSLEAARARAAAQLATFPDRYQRLDDPEPYQVVFSDPLTELRTRARSRHELIADAPPSS